MPIQIPAGSTVIGMPEKALSCWAAKLHVGFREDLAARILWRLY